MRRRDAQLLTVVASIAVLTGLLGILPDGSPVSAPTATIGEVHSPPVLSAAPTPGPGDWPTYLANPEHTAANPSETLLSVSDANRIGTDWTVPTSAPISTSAAVVRGVAYVGSWSGYEYALNTSNGAVLWKTFLGVTSNTSCPPRGIASSATISGGSLYVGGGDGNLYALDPTDGAVEWSYLVGEPWLGYYNWASPLIYRGSVYLGIASGCDLPLVPGGLLEINLTSHSLVNEFHTTPNGELGASVWGSPTVDPANNTIFIATGNAETGATGEFDDSVVALNASTLALESTWKIPAAQQVTDGDFGSTPTLFTISSGANWVGALNKNGYFYAWNASDVGAGPVWRDKLTTGQSVGSAGFADGMIFVGTGTASYDGSNSSGAAWALDPDSGNVLWESPLWGRSIAAPAYANGLLAIDGGSHLFLLNADTGARLREFACRAMFFAPPSIAHGRIFVGCADGNESAFGLPGSGGSPLTITSFAAAPNPVVVGGTTAFTTAVSGGSSPYRYAYSGLPTPCVTANSASLSCTPNEVGTFTVTVTVTDSAGKSASASTSLGVTGTGTALEFVETGLPSGTAWNVTVGGVTHGSTTPSITFSESAGKYRWTVDPVPHRAAKLESGSVTVGSSKVTVSVTFVYAYPVTFAESGLTAGTVWAVTVRGATLSTASTSLLFWVPNGTYSYALGAVPGYSGSGSPTSVVVAHAPATITVKFVAAPAVSVNGSSLPAVGLTAPRRLPSAAHQPK